jgi:predicted ATPase
MMTGNLQIYIGRAGGANSLLYYGAKTTLFIDGRLSFTTEAGINSYAFRLIHGAPDTFVFGSENVTFKATGFSGAPFVEEFGAGHKESRLPHWTDPAAQGSPPAFARGMLSKIRYFQFHDTSNEARIRGMARVDNNRSLFHNAGNVAAVLLRLRHEFPRCYNDVVGRVRTGVPPFRDFVLEPEHDQVLLEWTDVHRGHRFGPHQLSDGSIRLIALHTLLALPPPMIPAVIIIDEPELGLFPRAIETLVDAIRAASQRSQIILATQSNRLVRYLHAPSVICCAWRAGESTIERLSPADEFLFLDDYTLGDYMATVH